MTDLTTGILILTAACTVSLFLGIRVGALPGRRVSQTVLILAVLLMAAYLAFLWNRPVLAALLPTSNLIILANWLPLWGCFFVGTYVTSVSIHRSRRIVLGTAAICLCAYSAVAPVLGTSPACTPVRTSRSSLHYQSTPYTCSAACAVSLLQMHGIRATENELADLCLTRQGTHWMGLYRGLKLKTADTDWDVVAEPLSVDALRNRDASPCVLSVRIDVTAFPAGIDHGFRSDVGHSVIYLGSLSPEQITVFDPSPDFGIEAWDNRMLKCIDGGVALRLIPRNPATAVSLTGGRNLVLTTRNMQLVAGR